MPNLGYDDVTGWSEVSNTENAYRGVRVTATEAGTLTSVTARVWETSATGEHGAVALLYDSSGNLLDQSTCRNDITDSEGWVEFTGFSGYSLQASTDYDILIAVSSGGGSLSFRVETASNGRRISSPSSVPSDTCGAFSPDDPASIGGSSYRSGVYLTYTAAAEDYEASTGSLSLVGQSADVEVSVDSLDLTGTPVTLSLAGQSADIHFTVNVAGRARRRGFGYGFSGLIADVSASANNLHFDAQPGSLTLTGQPATFLTYIESTRRHRPGFGYGSSGKEFSAAFISPPPSTTIAFEADPGGLTFFRKNADFSVPSLGIYPSGYREKKPGASPGAPGQYPRIVMLGDQRRTVRSKNEEAYLIKKFWELKAGQQPTKTLPIPKSTKVTLTKRKMGANAQIVTVKQKKVSSGL